MRKQRLVLALLALIVALTIALLPATCPARSNAQNFFGYLLASAGADGIFGTPDDIYTTEAGQITKGQLPTNLVEALQTAGVPSASMGETPSFGGGSDEPQPLRQPASDEIVIRTPEELAKIGVDSAYPLSGKYILMANLDLSSYSNWTPIGNSSKPFTGTFDGNGLVIKNLTINRPSSDYQGLFGYTGSLAKLINISLQNVNVTGGSYTGGLVGNNSGTITSSYSTGSVWGRYNATGGLVGLNSGTITGSYFTGSVTGNSWTGGLVGLNYGTITSSYSTGSVTGNYYTGGLVGYNNGGTIESSYSTGNVEGSNDATGGLVGLNSGTITSSYWDTQTSGVSTSSGGTGKTTAQMKQQTTFGSWDFTTIWAIDEGVSYPYLRSNEQIPHPGTN